MKNLCVCVCARHTLSMACLRVTLSSALQALRFWRRACRQLWKIAQRHRRARMPGINTFRRMWEILAHVRAKPSAVNSHRWRQEFLFSKFWCDGHVERKNILIQAASSSVASAVTELFDIFPKLAACRHGESFLHNATHVGQHAILARTKVMSNAATAMAASSQLQKDVDAAVGLQSASINSVLKTARQAVITARSALF